MALCNTVVPSTRNIHNADVKKKKKVLPHFTIYQSPPKLIFYLENILLEASYVYVILMQRELQVPCTAQYPVKKVFDNPLTFPIEVLLQLPCLLDWYLSPEGGQGSICHSSCFPCWGSGPGLCQWCQQSAGLHRWEVGKGHHHPEWEKVRVSSRVARWEKPLGARASRLQSCVREGQAWAFAGSFNLWCPDMVTFIFSYVLFCFSCIMQLR